MKINSEQFEELSDIVLKECRLVDDLLQPKGGWKGWSTGGMRVLTNGVLKSVLVYLGVKIDRDEYE